MRKVLLAGVAALLMATSAANAQVTGDVLLKWCTKNNQQCDAYLLGVTDTIIALSPSGICMPDTTVKQQRALAVLGARCAPLRRSSSTRRALGHPLDVRRAAAQSLAAAPHHGGNKRGMRLGIAIAEHSLDLAADNFEPADRIGAHALLRRFAVAVASRSRRGSR